MTSGRKWVRRGSSRALSLHRLTPDFRLGEKIFFRRSAAAPFHFPTFPTAYAVGFILAPLCG
jgi:hypothetical protein